MNNVPFALTYSARLPRETSTILRLHTDLLLDVLYFVGWTTLKPCQRLKEQGLIELITFLPTTNGERLAFVYVDTCNRMFHSR